LKIGERDDKMLRLQAFDILDDITQRAITTNNYYGSFIPSKSTTPMN
jgi:hypothetical protein